MSQQRPGMFRPALVGGIVAGVLTAVPLVNCFCCLWIIGGAMVAAHLLAKDSPSALTSGDGAVVGILTGIVAAIVRSFVSLPFGIISSNPDTINRLREQLVELAENIPSWLSSILNDATERASGGFSIGWFLLTLLISAVFLAALGALGGTIGASIFGKKKIPPFPAQGVPDDKTFPNPSDRQP